MQYFRTRRQVGELLTDLGRTRDEVATKLGNTGVRGIRKNVHSCPISLYLNAILGTEANVRFIRVDRGSVQMLVGQMMMPMSIPLPEAVRAFIKAFDRRLYPELARDNREKQRGRACDREISS